MNTIFVPPPPVRVPDPKCPHCNRTLHGWSEPCDGATVVISVIIILTIIYVVTTFSFGTIESDKSSCKKWPQTYGAFLMPPFKLGCMTADLFSRRIDE